MTADSFSWKNRTNVARGLNIGDYPDMAGRIKVW